MVLLGPVVVAIGEGLISFGIMLSFVGITGGTVCAIGTVGKSARETMRMLKIGSIVTGVGLGVAVAGFVLKAAGYATMVAGGVLFIVGGAMVVTAVKRLNAASQQQLHGAEAEHARTLERVMPAIADHNVNPGEPIPLAILNLQPRGEHQHEPR
jgi:hypothetical protein